MNFHKYVNLRFDEEENQHFVSQSVREYGWKTNSTISFYNISGEPACSWIS